MADVPQNGLPIANFNSGELKPTSLFVMSYPAGSGYATGNMSADALGEGMGHDIPFASLNTSDKSLFGAINELLVISNRANKRVSGTLIAGNTSITLTDSDIHEDSYIKACSEDIILSPTSITVEEGRATLTYPAQSADVNVGIVLKGVSGGDSMHNYSETEQVVGTWTDGSTLYEKTVRVNADSAGVKTLWTDSTVVIREFNGCFINRTTGGVFPFWSRLTDNQYKIVLLSVGNNQTYNVFAEIDLGTERTNKLDLLLTIRYTKESV